MPPAGASGSGMGRPPRLAPPRSPSSGPSAEQTVRFGSSGGRSLPLDPPSAGPLFRLAGRRRRDGASPGHPRARPRPGSCPRCTTRTTSHDGAPAFGAPPVPLATYLPEAPPVTRSSLARARRSTSRAPPDLLASQIGALALTGAVAVIIPASAPVGAGRANAPPHQPHGAQEPSALDLGGAKSANSADFAPPKGDGRAGSSRAHHWPQKPRRHGTLGARRARQRRCR